MKNYLNQLSTHQGERADPYPLPYNATARAWLVLFFQDKPSRAEVPSSFRQTTERRENLPPPLVPAPYFRVSRWTPTF